MLILKNIVIYLTTELFFENLSFISIECLQGVVSFIALSLINITMLLVFPMIAVQ